MIWPITLAFLLKDFDFLKLLDIDYGSLNNTERSTGLLDRSIYECVKHGCTFLPAKAIPDLEKIFITQAWHGFMGFDQGAVRLALRDILPIVTKPKAIAAVEKLILDQ